MTAVRDAAFAGMVSTAHQASVARRLDDTSVELADIHTSLSDWRIALALANGLLPWMLDRNGNGVTS